MTNQFLIQCEVLFGYLIISCFRNIKVTESRLYYKIWVVSIRLVHFLSFYVIKVVKLLQGWQEHPSDPSVPMYSRFYLILLAFSLYFKFFLKTFFSLVNIPITHEIQIITKPSETSLKTSSENVEANIVSWLIVILKCSIRYKITKLQ